MVDEAAAASGVAGAQVCVILDEQRAQFVYGSANAELYIPMTGDTVVQVGSVTKVFNAAMIMTLVEDGRLDLDAPVVEYVPDLKLADKQAQETITLRQLLSMSAGLDNGHATPLKGDGALARYVALLRDIPQVFAPGRGFGYSSAGSCIAGYAAERATGTPWDLLMQKRVFEPAGLVHAVTLAEELPYHRVSVGHAPAQRGRSPKVVRPWHVSQGGGPGGATFATTAHDLARFGQLFINGGKAANGDQVLSQTAVRMMTNPTIDAPAAYKWGARQQWGLGPYVAHWGDAIVWGHAGGNQSGGAQLIWFPQKRAVLAFVINTIGAFDEFTARMFGDFSQAVLGVSAPTLAPPEPQLRIGDPRRFVGAFARNGMRYEISQDAGRLRYKEISLRRGGLGDALGEVVQGELVSLGGDRFLVKTPGPSGPISIAFFGDDGQGRAANLVVPMFATRRVDG